MSNNWSEAGPTSRSSWLLLPKEVPAMKCTLAGLLPGVARLEAHVAHEVAGA